MGPMAQPLKGNGVDTRIDKQFTTGSLQQLADAVRLGVRHFHPADSLLLKQPDQMLGAEVHSGERHIVVKHHRNRHRLGDTPVMDHHLRGRGCHVVGWHHQQRIGPGLFSMA